LKECFKFCWKCGIFLEIFPFFSNYQLDLWETIQEQSFGAFGFLCHRNWCLIQKLCVSVPRGDDTLHVLDKMLKKVFSWICNAQKILKNSFQCFGLLTEKLLSILFPSQKCWRNQEISSFDLSFKQLQTGQLCGERNWPEVNTVQGEHHLCDKYAFILSFFNNFSKLFNIFFLKEQNGLFLRKQRFNKHLNTKIWLVRVLRRYYFACFGQNFEKKFFHACNAHLIMKTYFLFLVDLMYLCWKFCYFHATVERIKESVQFNHQLLACTEHYAANRCLWSKRTRSEAISGQRTSILLQVCIW